MSNEDIVEKFVVITGGSNVRALSRKFCNILDHLPISVLVSGINRRSELAPA
jgi:hypothetical protein